MRVRRSPAVAGLIVVAVGLTVTGWWAQRQDRRDRDALDAARGHVASGRYHLARPALDGLAADRPSWDEVHFLIGLCEQGEGHTDAAMVAWGKVPRGSPFEGRAAVEQARAEMNRGRLAGAERAAERAVTVPGPHADDARRTLALIFQFQGRSVDARRALRDGLGVPPSGTGPLARDVSERVANTVRALWAIDRDTLPVSDINEYLNRAEPGDGRVMLGLAALDVRAGRFDDAAKRIEGCLVVTPDDPAVWRARLEWARAADRPGAAVACLGRVAVAHDVDSAREAVAEAQGIRAWLAARRGDRKGERLALEARLKVDPADPAALDRLAEIEVLEGKADPAARLRSRKADRDRDRSEYARLLATPNRAGDLARLARLLGREFDARWWSRLAGEPPPREVETTFPHTLADLLPELSRHDPTYLLPSENPDASVNVSLRL